MKTSTSQATASNASKAANSAEKKPKKEKGDSVEQQAHDAIASFEIRDATDFQVYAKAQADDGFKAMRQFSDRCKDLQGFIEKVRAPF